jgi:hypothetical protein
MKCDDFTFRLEAFVDGTMPAALRRDVERHLAACPRCRQLEQVVRGDLGLAEGAPDPGLTRTILERTSGAACPAAEGRLCALVDGSLAGTDAELVRLHLEHCGACRDLAGALAFASEALPTMAEIDPGPFFTRRVMEATRRRRRWAADGLAALRGWPARIVLRPRFALEAAYGGALFLWLLFGAPMAPWREVPSRALALSQVNPVRGLAGLAGAARVHRAPPAGGTRRAGRGADARHTPRLDRAAAPGRRSLAGGARAGGGVSGGGGAR